MGRNRFTVSAVERIPLSDGDWIEIKRDLNNGEVKKLEACGQQGPVKLAGGDIVYPVDWERYEIERAAIWLLDWSFRDANDKAMPLKDKDGVVMVDALRALNPEDFTELNNAIVKFVTARAVEKVKEKNARRLATQPQSQPSNVAEPDTPPTLP